MSTSGVTFGAETDARDGKEGNLLELEPSASGGDFDYYTSLYN